MVNIILWRIVLKKEDNVMHYITCTLQYPSFSKKQKQSSMTVLLEEAPFLGKVSDSIFLLYNVSNHYNHI